MDLSACLPSAPLQKVIARTKRVLGMSWGEFGAYLRVSPRTLHRVMAATQIGVHAADHMAIRLGLHPVLLWPSEWPIPEVAPATNGTRPGTGAAAKAKKRAPADQLQRAAPASGCKASESGPVRP
ncbi:MAG: hypothetical protein ACRDJ4_13605 [Actinomycetota bacterium]